MYKPEEVVDICIQIGVNKVKKPLREKCILGFIAGAMISLGYLVDIRVSASVAESWGSFASFIGACVFPIGLIVILLGGGELITGNIMTVSIAWLDKKVILRDMMMNWIIITIMNFIGAIFVAYCFGHLAGLTTSGDYLHLTTKMSHAKISSTALESFISGVGCNWFVCLAVWLCAAIKDGAGKIMGIWFPIMTFVAIGFQHSVANMFVIPAAIFEGNGTWGEFVENFIPVYFGNILGGMVMVAMFYYYAYKHHSDVKY